MVSAKSNLPRKSASVRDLRSPSLYSRRSSPDENNMFYSTSKAQKRLSIKPEEINDTEDDDGNISDHSTTSSASYSSSMTGMSPRQQRHYSNQSQYNHQSPPTTCRNYQNRYNKPHPLKHAQSVDNIFMMRSRPSPPRDRRVLDQNYIFGSTMQRTSSRRKSSNVSQSLTKMRSCENLLSSSTSSLHHHQGSLSSLGLRRASSKSNNITQSANLTSMRSSLMTSSYRNLADRNVRESEEPAKVRGMNFKMSID